MKIKKTILVTGGNGFIGRHLIKCLLEKQYSVISLDNSYRWSSAELTIFLPVTELQNFRSVQGDILDTSLIEKLVTESDIVVHLAGISQVMTSIDYPETTFKYNITGTENVIMASAKQGKKIIFSSSREVYGRAEILPVSIHAAIKPENPYGISKAANEKFILATSKQF